MRKKKEKMRDKDINFLFQKTNKISEINQDNHNWKRSYFKN